MNLNFRKTALLAGICSVFSLGYTPQLFAVSSVDTVEAVQQTKKITGVVSDAMGPIIGANVLEKGTTNGVITDIDGNFALNVKPGATIVVSFIGYVSQEIKITDQTTVNITLKEDSEMLDEVVVVGYGTMKKSDLSGASVSMSEDKIKGVYLTKSGLSGTRNADDLAKAAEYSKDVINNSGRNLLANYSDVFRLANNKNEECLFSWHWSAGRDPWTQQNTLQSDLAMVGFDEFGDCWGGYAGPSVDLQDAFGISALESPETRSDTDTRRKATMMMAGDVYSYFWQDKGGFDYLRFIYDAEYGKGGPNGDYQSPTGANHVKHLYGNNNDHLLGLGVSAGNMYSGLATHILRLSDIYLVYAEAKMGLATSTTDQSALDAFNAVRGRAIPGVTPKTSITWEDVWKERRLELACEGDRWYDYVRLAYYDSQRAINELKAQRRDVYYNLGTTYKAYYENGSWTVNPDETRYNPDAKAPNVTVSSFTLPFPTEDVVFNPNLMKDPVHVDVRSEFSY